MVASNPRHPLTDDIPSTARQTKENHVTPTSTALPIKPRIRLSRGILLSTLYAGIVAIAANSIIIFSGLAAGAARETTNHQPITAFSIPVYVALSVLGVLAGAAGWALIGRRARNPQRALAIAVPVVWAITLVPLVASGLMSETSAVWTAMITLGIVHLITVIIGVVTYSRVLPLARLEP
jgi:cytochrome bd-type quinol oxidase subunit 2